MTAHTMTEKVMSETAALAAPVPVLTLYNGKAAARRRVPCLSYDDFSRLIVSGRARGRRVVSLFGTPHSARLVDERGEEEGIELTVVLAVDESGALELARTVVTGASFASLTPRCTEVHLFEREIAEQWGITPEGHPWKKPVRFHHAYTPGRDAWGRTTETPVTVGITDFFRVEGEEVHEVAVGPVHAGVIEPGHFRFQCHGEEVFHLEISLGYQHRGVERALVGGPNKRTIHYMETLAGDTTAGHTCAYLQAVEGLAGRNATSRGAALRGIALELERLANHTGDLGALANDVGFLPTASC